MAHYLRLRQICLVASDIDKAEADIAAVLGVPVCYRDPAVAAYGLDNLLFPLGPDILEVVVPTRDDTAAGRFLERSAGRGGYMVIMDCDDVARRREQAEAAGVRVIHTSDSPGYTGVQLHPRDCRAAMLDFNCTEGGAALDGPYHPAGDAWPSIVRPDALPRLDSIAVESTDPDDLAAHWGRIMDLPVLPGPELRPTRGRITFHRCDSGERLIGLTLAVADPAQTLAAAAARGLEHGPDWVWLCGVRVSLVRAA
jgi:hypothetical protein